MSEGSEDQEGTRDEEAEAEKYGYSLGKPLGFGSYGQVREAYSRKLKCRVAMKIINKKTAPKEFIVKFLPREIETCKKLNNPHENLVTFYQTLETKNRVYMAMELCMNGNLLDVIETRKYVTEPTAGLWFSQIVLGVEYLHEDGIVHRDLKCENILLDKNDNIKITDFGFARSDMKPGMTSTKILSKTFCGSYAYAPPEILSGIPYEPMKADIWSMGIILFAMLFGKLPFKDVNLKNFRKQVKNKVPFPPTPPVPNDCKCLIMDILTTADKRATIHTIKNDTWFMKMMKPSANLRARSSVTIMQEKPKGGFWMFKREKPHRIVV